jgi:hypothetical protein
MYIYFFSTKLLVGNFYIIIELGKENQVKESRKKEQADMFSSTFFKGRTLTIKNRGPKSISILLSLHIYFQQNLFSFLSLFTHFIHVTFRIK